MHACSSLRSPFVLTPFVHARLRSCTNGALVLQKPTAQVCLYKAEITWLLLCRPKQCPGRRLQLWRSGRSMQSSEGPERRAQTTALIAERACEGGSRCQLEPLASVQLRALAVQIILGGTRAHWRLAAGLLRLGQSSCCSLSRRFSMFRRYLSVHRLVACLLGGIRACPCKAGCCWRRAQLQEPGWTWGWDQAGWVVASTAGSAGGGSARGGPCCMWGLLFTLLLLLSLHCSAWQLRRSWGWRRCRWLAGLLLLCLSSQGEGSFQDSSCLGWLGARLSFCVTTPALSSCCGWERECESRALRCLWLHRICLWALWRQRVWAGSLRLGVTGGVACWGAELQPAGLHGRDLLTAQRRLLAAHRLVLRLLVHPTHRGSVLGDYWMCQVSHWSGASPQVISGQVSPLWVLLQLRRECRWHGMQGSPSTALVWWPTIRCALTLVWLRTGLTWPAPVSFASAVSSPAASTAAASRLPASYASVLQAADAHSGGLPANTQQGGHLCLQAPDQAAASWAQGHSSTSI